MNATYLLSLLPLLACPLLMGGMMWLMMRMGTRQDATAPRDAPVSTPAAVARPDARLAALHAELDALETQQAALAAQLGQPEETASGGIERRSQAGGPQRVGGTGIVPGGDR